MILWRFTDPSLYDQYARAGRRGTWIGTPSERVPPLIIEWERDSDVVGDFTWPGFDDDIMVTDRVGRFLLDSGVKGFELKPVKMIQTAKPPKTRSRIPRIWLPYKGPKLWDLWPTCWEVLDFVRSSLRWYKRRNGTKDFKVVGVELFYSRYSIDKGVRTVCRRKRTPGKGLFVTAKRGIFRIKECPAWIFCSNDVKELIESQKFTNVTFLEMGDMEVRD